MTVLVISTALVSVGLTAPADGPFSIVVHPVFLGIASTSSSARSTHTGSGRRFPF